MSAVAPPIPPVPPLGVGTSPEDALRQIPFVTGFGVVQQFRAAPPVGDVWRRTFLAGDTVMFGYGWLVPGGAAVQNVRPAEGLEVEWYRSQL